jgi:predicted DNA-binding transcriptional regulator AlpA
MATELLTALEVAQLLGLKPKTLARWRWKGKGPVFRKIGRKIRYARNDIEEYIASSARRSTSDPGPDERARPAA